MEKDNLFVDTKDSWIQTFTGKLFNVFDFDPAMIDILDIAHALSNQCRFSGHVKQFYSVAEHSYWVATLSKEPLKALLHDASEAYLVDIPRPIKPHLTNYVKIEEKLQRAIFKKFGLSENIPNEIKIIDSRMCVTEGEKLMPDISHWKMLDKFAPFSSKWMIECWSPAKAKHYFLTLFMQLTGGKLDGLA